MYRFTHLHWHHLLLPEGWALVHPFCHCLVSLNSFFHSRFTNCHWSILPPSLRKCTCMSVSPVIGLFFHKMDPLINCATYGTMYILSLSYTPVSCLRKGRMNWCQLIGRGCNSFLLFSITSLVMQITTLALFDSLTKSPSQMVMTLRMNFKFAGKSSYTLKKSTRKRATSSIFGRCSTFKEDTFCINCLTFIIKQLKVHKFGPFELHATSRAGATFRPKFRGSKLCDVGRGGKQREKKW